MKTFYEILGVQRDASRHEIREAFLHAAQTYHPDLQRDEFEDERQFKQIRRVYEVLIDPKKRRLYDQQPFLFPLGSEASWENKSPIVTSPGNVRGTVNFGLDNYPRQQRRSLFKAISIATTIGLGCLVGGYAFMSSVPATPPSAPLTSRNQVETVPSSGHFQADGAISSPTQLDHSQAPEHRFLSPDIDRRRAVIDLQFREPLEFDAAQAGPIADDLSASWNWDDEVIPPAPVAQDSSVDRDAWLTKAKVADDLNGRLQIQTTPLPEIELPELERNEFPEFEPLEITSSLESPTLLHDHQIIGPNIGHLDAHSTTHSGFGFLPTASRESLARDFVNRFNQRHSVFDRSVSNPQVLGGQTVIPVSPLPPNSTQLPPGYRPVPGVPTGYTSPSPSRVMPSPMPRSPISQGERPSSPTIGRAHQPAQPLLPPSFR